ncbi:MAG: phospholipase D-like domain-containing protein [Vulcanimicrobiaceae bacterium]
MVTLSSTDSFLAAIASARSVQLSAYFLHPGRVLDALAAAARRGTQLRVRVEASSYGGDPDAMFRMSARAVGQLHKLGADAQLVGPGATAPLLHGKLAVVDGVLYADDRNWTQADTIITDTSARDVRAASDAIAGRADPPSKSFATMKGDAIQLESRLLAGAHSGAPVVVESETFGGGAISVQLDRLGRAGVHPRLLVSARPLQERPAERTTLARLAADGVEVRVCSTYDKFAVVGSAAWIGSANATFTSQRTPTFDWGLRTSTGNIGTTLRTEFERRWSRAKPLPRTQ